MGPIIKLLALVGFHPSSLGESCSEFLLGLVFLNLLDHHLFLIVDAELLYEVLILLLSSIFNPLGLDQLVFESTVCLKHFQGCLTSSL